MKSAYYYRFVTGTLGALLGGAALPVLAQEITAESDPVVLDTIVITAAGFAQQIVDAPATITVIDSDDIASKPYSSVADVMRDIPGVVVSAPSSRSGGEQVSIRGLGEEYVLTLIDGKPIGNSQEATYNGYGSGLAKTYLPPPSAIERIEVIRGPMSSLYGSAASGGVINIITKPVADVWSGSTTVGLTSYKNGDAGDAREARFYLSGPVSDRLGLALFGSYHDRDKDRMVVSGRSGDTLQSQEIDRKSLGARLNWVLNDMQDLSFEVASSTNDTETTTLETGDSNGIGVDRMNYSIRHNLSWGTGYETTSFVTFEDVDFENGNNVSGYEMLNFNSKTNMAFGNHEMTVGIDYRDEKTVHDLDRFLSDPRDQNARPNAAMERWHWALFGEDNYSINDDLTVTMGLRYDDNEKYGSKVTPRVYGVWHATDALTIKGGVSGGYNVPSLKQADSNIFESAGGGRGSDQGNTDLKPEETTNFEIGAIWESAGGAQLGLTAYHTRFKNGIDRNTVCDIAVDTDCGQRPNGDPNQWIRQYVNRDRAELSGIEATADFSLGDVDIAMNYTYADSKITKGEAEGERFNNNPRHVVNIGVDWQATPALNTWANAQYRSDTFDTGSSFVEEHATFDIGVHYDVNDNFRASAAVYNVGDKTFGTTNYNDGRRYFVGLTSTF
ncbi:TonB-dependent receptor [Paracoccus sp. SCSIO 75233]|uniref:TonB-dependent receptor domain-containing protein n=1 Tax=Paracoccus sp. SCSIO 75233 TaxID=3017782 RepID=UPI0022F07C24|nr:TonB-dependent receptor [Paracoccus sp. SCSIO 75233]WBU54447.1 TonB-dependent receptor [Paracoccus sp. SCSIO 75233]